MTKNYITSAGCISEFEKIGLDVSKAYFSKLKAKGTFRTYFRENSSREYFIFDEVIEDFLNSTLPRDYKESKQRTEVIKIMQTKKAIDAELKIIHGFKELKAEMFDIGNFYKTAQENLEEMKALDLQGKTVTDADRLAIEAEAQKTKEDHAREFDRELYAENQTALILRDMTEDIRYKFGQKYSDFENSGLELDLVKIVASWIPSAEGIVECYGVQLKRKEVSK